MALALHDTLRRERLAFEPLEPGRVRMYTCGPTVHDYAHIGNLRTFLFEDLLRRVLEARGYDVTQVMNLTDVDDKIIDKARAAGVPIAEFTRRYTDAFFEDLATLRVERAEHYPTATGHIPAMVALVKRLEAGGHTYRTDDGSIWFRITTFPGYGRLSRVDLSGMRDGARVDSDEYDKEDPKDFALLSFGGGGGLVAVDVARELSIPTVIVPPGQGAFSAFGMLFADVQHDFAQTSVMPLADLDETEVTALVEETLEGFREAMARIAGERSAEVPF